MNINQTCMKCMTGKINEEGKCTSCGELKGTEKNGSIHLPLRTILKGKYLVGNVIGEGGFGITYIGYDLDLEIRVAIKEFCPKHSVGREAEDGLTLYPYNESSAEEFEREKEKFINEARRLAKFRNEGGVVSVLDYFIENGTAYIVMDYIDGITLKSYLKTLRDTTGRNMNMAGVLNLFKPVMETLAKIHKSGIIHRDISPENIMISKDFTKVYLIDFGTARDVENGHTLSEYYKGFYSPIEQRSSQSKGKMEQGPWTDVYALCATIYVCITGRVMSDSVSRIVEDDLISPSKFGIDISPAMEAVLMQGLAVKPQDRIQSVEELMQAFYGENETVKPETKKEVSNVNVVAAKPKTIENNETKAVDNNCQSMRVRNQDLECEKRIYKNRVDNLETYDNCIQVIAGVALGIPTMEVVVSLLHIKFIGLSWGWIFCLYMIGVAGILGSLYFDAEIKKTILSETPNDGNVRLQMDIIRKLRVYSNCVFVRRYKIDLAAYKAKYFKYRGKHQHTCHLFAYYGKWENRIVFYRHELINYYNTVILPSNLPEDLKAEWKQAAIDSWVIIEE